MTPLTTATHKLNGLRYRVSLLPLSKQELTEYPIKRLSEIIDIFISRKRKTEKNQMDSLYEWFEDEFNTASIDVIEILEKYEGK
jgi:molybdopterin-guanine dinucleotide biosynthesis protein A